MPSRKPKAKSKRKPSPHWRSPRIPAPSGKNYNPHKKVREAAFFLGKMRDSDRDERLDKEDFDFFVSAFLSAARTVILALPSTLVGLKSPWWKGLPKNDRELYEDLKTLRDDEIHVGYADRAETIEHEPVSEVQARRSTPRSPHTFVLSPYAFDAEATIGVKRHWFNIDGKNVPAVELCERGLALLKATIAGFVASGALPPE